MSPFLKDAQGKPLTVYRGECANADIHEPKGNLRCLYFGNIETANNYATPNKTGCEYHGPRIFPAHLVIKRPFMNEPTNPFLDLQLVINRLGRAEAERIAIRFAKWIEETDQWARINKERRYKGVEDYLRSPMGDVSQLYFQAFVFFQSFMEVGRLSRLGYDGAIHRGSGWGSAEKPEYCVFSRKQVYLTISQSFLE